MLYPGDPLPSLIVRACGNPRYVMDTVAGRHVVLLFIASSRIPGVQALLEQIYASGDLFDDVRACCFLVTSDPVDEAAGRLRDRVPGVRVIWDMDRTLATLFGCVSGEGAGAERFALYSFIVDPGLRVQSVVPVSDLSTHFGELRDRLTALLPARPDLSGTAPMLTIPNVLEPELCRALVAYAEAQGLEESGFMRSDPVSGATQKVVDYSHKRRSDCNIEEEDLRDALRARVMRRLVPPIQRAFQFEVTRMERYIVACYDSGSGGWFRPHKDNTTKGTAHRRFAVTINLNAEDYDGGDLRFPEFGLRNYRAPTGGAVVFSCSLLHEALPITRGRRYCTLPFLYDEAAAQIRLENARFLSDPALRADIEGSVVPPRTN